MFYGVIQFVIYAPIQWWAGGRIETVAGWLRTAIIWFICGLGGEAVSGLFAPYIVNCGPTGSITGLVGVLFVGKS